MQRLKLVTVVGTRPELIRLSRVIAAADQHFDHTLVHTGQNYDFELNEIFFQDLGIRRPDHFLDCAAGSSGAIATIANILVGVDALLAETQPEALLVLGDTNSCLSVIPAKRRQIPVFHMEAGNRCFDMRVPEEINRRLVDHVADINMAYSDIAREYLLREGVPADQVIKTGSPMSEVLAHSLPRVNESDVLSRLGLSEHQFFVVSAHREENIESPERFDGLVEIVNGLAAEYGMPVVVSVHPRTQARIDRERPALDKRVILLRPLGFHDYIRLQISARVVLSDSGTISEESSILNFPALNLREAHERPEAFEEGAVMMVGTSWIRVKQSVAILQSQGRGEKRDLRVVRDYDVPNVSEKVVRIIQSYTDYVKRVVWRRY